MQLRLRVGELTDGPSVLDIRDRQSLVGDRILSSSTYLTSQTFMFGVQLLNPEARCNECVQKRDSRWPLQEPQKSWAHRACRTEGIRGDTQASSSSHSKPRQNWHDAGTCCSPSSRGIINPRASNPMPQPALNPRRLACPSRDRVTNPGELTGDPRVSRSVKASERLSRNARQLLSSCH